MRHHTTTRLWLAIALLEAALAAHAQGDLAVNAAFERYGSMKGCKMVTLHDGTLKGYKLKVYKSLTYRKHAQEIAEMLNADRKRAKKIREVVVDGTVTGGYYQMPPLKNGLNRYVLFRHAEDGTGAVVYMEGTLGPDDIMKISKR